MVIVGICEVMRFLSGEFVYMVIWEDAPWNVFVTLDEEEAERAAAELGIVVGRHRIKVSGYLLGDRSWWPEYLSNLKFFGPARQFAQPRVLRLERLGAAACLLWPEARYPAADDACGRLSAIFADIQLEPCDTLDAVGNEDIVWVVRHGPKHEWPWPEDPRANVRLILASGRPRPQTVLVWMHTAYHQDIGLQPFVCWQTVG